MDDAFFSPLDARSDGGSFASAPATAGPWSPELQHGGPPNALAVTVAERVLAESTGRADLHALRLASDFVGPVPVGELDVTARVVRAARSAALVEVVVRSGGRDCLLSRVWFVRDADTSAVAPPLADASEDVATAPEDGAPLDFSFPYGNALEWVFTEGGLRRTGPGTAWVRPRIPLLTGHGMSGLTTVVLVADSASGISAELDWNDWTFVNVDLDVHLLRPVHGEWVRMEATTRLGPHGSALAVSTLSDLRGVVGAGLQTLVLAPTRR